MPTSSPGWPCCNAAFLQDVLTALRQRSKAIRYPGDLSCSCAIEETRDGPVERLNIDLADTLFPARLRRPGQTGDASRPAESKSVSRGCGKSLFYPSVAE